MNNVESRLQRYHPGRLQLLFNDPAYSIGRYRTRSIIIILQFKDIWTNQWSRLYLTSRRTTPGRTRRSRSCSRPTKNSTRSSCSYKTRCARSRPSSTRRTSRPRSRWNKCRSSKPRLLTRSLTISCSSGGRSSTATFRWRRCRQSSTFCMLVSRNNDRERTKLSPGWRTCCRRRTRKTSEDLILRYID